MNCPYCKTKGLKHKVLENELHTLHCESCRGHWIQSYQYWKWLNLQAGRLAETYPDVEPLVVDQPAVKRCPECETVLTKYRVGCGAGFFIDRCSICAGMWFDRNDWEVLERRNLQDEIHYIFGAPWQKLVRDDALQKVEEAQLLECLGEDKYQDVVCMRNWLNQDKHRAEILMYLTRTDS